MDTAQGELQILGRGSAELFVEAFHLEEAPAIDEDRGRPDRLKGQDLVVEGVFADEGDVALGKGCAEEAGRRIVQLGLRAP